jgi:hypothetical protein
MAAQMLGKLWVLLRPTEEEQQDVGSHLAYQQQIILEVIVIVQFGFDQQVFIQPPPTFPSNRVPVVLRYLHQLINLGYTSDYFIVQDIPEVTEEQLYQYNWSAGYTFHAVTYTSGRRDTQQ